MSSLTRVERTFRPKSLKIVNATEEAFANRLLRQAAPFLKPTPKHRSSSAEYKAPSAKADERRQTPLGIHELEGFGPLGTSTIPKEEQDVVGLFFELIGLGVFRQIRALREYERHGLLTVSENEHGVTIGVVADLDERTEEIVRSRDAHDAGAAEEPL